MTRMQQTIGNAVAEWEDSAPLIWAMSETKHRKGRPEQKTEDFDLSVLKDGYTMEFLLAYKDLLIERRNRVALSTVNCEFGGVRLLLAKMQAALGTAGKIAVIDHTFLTALREFDGDLLPYAHRHLANYFNAHGASPIFAHGLVESDFPKKTAKKGKVGKQIETILAKALSRAATVYVLSAVERAWEKGEIGIDLFSFTQVAFLTFVRPETYIHLTLDDLFTKINDASGEKTYYLLLTLPKTRANNAPDRVPFKLNQRIGELLCLQRIHVQETYGHLVDQDNLNRLALFPNRHLNEHGQWEADTANQHHGRLSSQNLRAHYLAPLRALANTSFDFNALRHTVGTQLASAGLSGKEIQAILKHAAPETCRAYVDIHFNSLMEKLSEAMEPAFIEHFPVIERFRARGDPIDVSKAIISRSPDGRHRELTGECGASLAAGTFNRCQYAPICCYACHRFIPCYDVDHNINLDVVEDEIRRYGSAGTPFKTMLDKSKEARLYIMLVAAASERYHETLEQEPQQ